MEATEQARSLVGSTAHPHAPLMAERPPRTPRRCPACGADKPLRIAYGEPTPDIFEAAERGELVLGGCCIAAGLPTRQCRACGATFGSLRAGRLR